MKKHKQNEPEGAAGEDAPAALDEVQTEADSAAAEETEFERALRERNEYLGQWQRAQADYQNLKRRHLTEIEQSRRRQMQPLLENLLLVLDNLDMALMTECTTTESQNLATGIQLTRDQFLRALEQEGVAPVSVDCPFDPNVHEAVASVSSEEANGAAPGTILATVRAGYRWGDVVLRPAHVRVVAEPQQAEPGSAAPGASRAESSQE